MEDMQLYYSIDKIADGFAVLLPDEGEEQVVVPYGQLPLLAKEGDMLVRQDGQFVLAPEETRKRRAKIEELLHQLLRPEGEE